MKGIDHLVMTTDVTTSPDGVTEPTVIVEPVPLSFILYLLTGLLLSIIIFLTNLLLLTSIIKYYRMQTASNCFLLSLSLADGLVGVVLPVTLMLQLSGANVTQPGLCLLPLCLLASLSVVSLLTTAAIAADRCTSLAQPLRYNNIVTRRGVARYAVFCWTYGGLVGVAPLALRHWRRLTSSCDVNTQTCEVVTGCEVSPLDRTVAGGLVAGIYVPVAISVVSCYLYVYCVARTHAKAIHTVEVSLSRAAGGSVVSGPARYGVTLLFTVGAFIVCWTPLSTGLITQADWFYNSEATRGWLLLLALSSAAINPFVYGFHSAELRFSCHRLLETVLAQCGIVWWGSVRHGTATFSTASNIRLCTMATNHTCILREVCVKETVLCDGLSLCPEAAHGGTAADNPVTPV